jgi:hypothetical protein
MSHRPARLDEMSWPTAEIEVERVRPAQPEYEPRPRVRSHEVRSYGKTSLAEWIFIVSGFGLLLPSRASLESSALLCRERLFMQRLRFFSCWLASLVVQGASACNELLAARSRHGTRGHEWTSHLPNRHV